MYWKCITQKKYTVKLKGVLRYMMGRFLLNRFRISASRTLVIPVDTQEGQYLNMYSYYGADFRLTNNLKLLLK